MFVFIFAKILDPLPWRHLHRYRLGYYFSDLFETLFLEITLIHPLKFLKKRTVNFKKASPLGIEEGLKQKTRQHAVVLDWGSRSNAPLGNLV